MCREFARPNGMIADDPMAEAIGDNLASWNDRADAHANGGYRDVERLVRDPGYITSVVRRDMAVLAAHLPGGSVRGLRLLHLQCHIGTDTLSWAHAGAAEVYGLDFSPVALRYARDMVRRAGAAVEFVEGDARHAVRALPDRRASFDVVVTSAGTITWLPELKAWARSIAELLVPGGVFAIRDDHPLLFALDYAGLHVVQDAVGGSRISYDADTSYATDPENLPVEGTLAHTRNHNWAHDFQEVVGALLEAGLVVEAVGEHEVADWQSLPVLRFDPADEGWRMPAASPRIPLTFSVVARRPCV